MAVPTMLPSEATPLTEFGKKRRHSAFVDLTVEDEEVATVGPLPNTTLESETRQDGSTQPSQVEQNREVQQDGEEIAEESAEESDEEDDERTLWEQMVDSFEDQPFINGILADCICLSLKKPS